MMRKTFPRGRAGWWQLGRRLGLLAVVVIGGWLLLLGCAERVLLYPARLRPAPAPLDLPDHARRLAVEHEDGETHAHLYLGDGVDAENPGPVVMFSHGNGDLIEDYVFGLPEYQGLGVSVLLVEYRGCGNADGKPTKPGILADHAAFYDLLLEQPDVDPDRIVFHGRSMGGGIVAELARQRPPAALVLESTYTSIKDYARRLLVPGFIVKDNYDVAETLRSFPGPVFMAHSPRDEVVPYRMSEKNRAARPADLPAIDFLKLNVTHNEPMPPVFFERVGAFLAENGLIEPES